MSDIVERLLDPLNGPNLLKIRQEAADEIGRLRAALQDLIDRWPDERGYDGAIQRARSLLMEHALRSPSDEDVRRAMEQK